MQPLNEKMFILLHFIILNERLSMYSTTLLIHNVKIRHPRAL